jgi:hypothetical protein
MRPEPKETVSEDRQSLWMLTASPTIWAAHFLASYIGGAVWCGKIVDRSDDLGSIRAAIVALGFIALVGIAYTGWAGWRRHSYGDADPPHDADTPEDRHRFLGLATVLLSALSALATVYVSISTLFIRSCW